MESKPKKELTKYEAYKEYYNKALKWYKYKAKFTVLMEQEVSVKDEELIKYYSNMLKEMEDYEKTKPKNPNWEDWCDWRWK